MKKFLYIFWRYWICFVPSYELFIVTNVSTEIDAILASFILFSPFFFYPKQSKKYMELIFILLWTPALITFFHRMMFKVPLHASSVEQIFLSRGGMTTAFIRQFLPEIGMCLFAFLLIVLFSLRSKSENFFSLKKLTKQLYFVYNSFFLFILCFRFFSSGFYWHNSLFYAFSSGYSQYKANREWMLKQNKNKTLLPFTDIRTETNKATYVVIIGESETKVRSFLYGYQKNTTPHLKERDLFVFKNVYAPHTHTGSALQKVLTLASFSHPEWDKKYGSVIDFFKQAGFKTFWISTPPQQDYWSGRLIAKISEVADYQFFLNKGQSWKEHDIDLLPVVERALLDSADKKIIFVHLMGSHFPYSDRYSKRLKQKGFSDYENTVYATNLFVDNVLKKLDKTGGDAWLIYFSDHGEYLGCRCHTESLGHSEMFQVPFIFWASETFKRKHVMPSKKALEMPFNTENLFHTLADLTFTTAKEVDINNSIFNDERKDSFIKIALKADQPPVSFVITNDLIFKESRPIERGQVILFEKDNLEIKWYDTKIQKSYHRIHGVYIEKQFK